MARRDQTPPRDEAASGTRMSAPVNAIRDALGDRAADADVLVLRALRAAGLRELPSAGPSFAAFVSMHLAPVAHEDLGHAAATSFLARLASSNDALAALSAVRRAKHSGTATARAALFVTADLAVAEAARHALGDDVVVVGDASALRSALARLGGCLTVVDGATIDALAIIESVDLGDAAGVMIWRGPDSASVWRDRVQVRSRVVATSDATLERLLVLLRGVVRAA